MKTTILSILYLALFVLMLPSQACAQRDNVWVLENDANRTLSTQFNFTHDKPDTVIYKTTMGIIDGFNICDTNGRLLYYTNGRYINNRNNDSLYNTVGFNAGYLADSLYNYLGMLIPQDLVFLPHPVKPYLYYVIANSGVGYIKIHNVPFPGAMLHANLSVIDARLDGGLGGIIPGKKAIPLGNDTMLNCITAVKHADGRSWWLLMHGLDNTMFVEYLITGDTILGPYRQNIGNVFCNNNGPQIVFSPQGTTLCAIQDDGYCPQYANQGDIYDFDRCTGVISNWRHIPQIVSPSLTFVTGCSFSPNGRYLYICDKLHIYQYDATTPNPAATQTLVATWDSTATPSETYFNLMQLAPDGRIYICIWGGDSTMHYIQYPDSAGTKCHVVQNGITFAGVGPGGGIPQFPFYNLGAIGSVVTNAGADKTITAGDTTTIGMPAVKNCIYTWLPATHIDNPQGAAPDVWPAATTTYTLTVTDTTNLSQQCGIQIYTVTVTVIPKTDTLPPAPAMIVPTLITSSTTTWHIINKPPILSAEVYDMVGRRLFYTPDYTNNYDLRRFAAGMYIYILRTPTGTQWTGKLEVMR